MIANRKIFSAPLISKLIILTEYEYTDINSIDFTRFYVVLLCAIGCKYLYNDKLSVLLLKRLCIKLYPICKVIAIILQL